ncbi:oligosaccharide flippase family protein [Falsihalocynthiibacter sp. S25ZX9]|uniref:oligosaccharide flippase family protein n=1 Tax=Falsihalocynthiibacter sp. S25ZX9 TaxID=3240870 RepID=UPI00350F1555
MKRPVPQFKGGLWVAAARILSQLIQFGIFVVAARVLTPADFGVFALVAAVIVFLNLIATAGWSEYVMNWQGDSVRLRQTLFVAAIFGAVIATLGLVISIPLASFFKTPDAGPLARILSLAVFFSAGATTYGGILIWQKRLATSASCALVGESVNFAIAASTLLMGHGIMSLAYGRLAGAIAACLCGLVASGIRPLVIRQFGLVQEMVGFSWNITVTRLLMTFRAYGATLIIGGFLGPAAVGYYRAAQRVVGAFEEIISEPVRVLAWSFFRNTPQIDGSSAEISEAGNKFFPILIYASTPVFIGIILMAHDLTLGILGSEWLAAVPVIKVLAIAGLIRASGTASVPILSVVGKVALLPRYMLIYALVSIACISIGAMNGLLATAVSEVVAATLVFAISARVMRQHAGLRWSAIFMRSWAVLPAIVVATGVILILLEQNFLGQLHPLVRFVCLGLVMVAVYLPILFRCDRTLWSRLIASSAH